jgi:hypothetical protein
VSDKPTGLTPLYVRPTLVSSGLPYYILNALFNFRSRQNTCYTQQGNVTIVASSKTTIRNQELAVSDVDVMVPGGMSGLDLELHKPIATAPTQRVNINFVNISSKFHNRQNKRTKHGTFQ